MNEDLMNKNLVKYWETRRKPNSIIKIYFIDEEGKKDKRAQLKLEQIEEDWYIVFIIALQNKNIKEVRFIAD